MWSIVTAAGWPIWPLIIASLTALALIIERALALRATRVYPPGLLSEVLAAPQRTYSQESLHELAAHSPLGTVLAGGLACPQRDRAHLQYAFEVAGNKAAAALERFLPLISMLASIAPLMGLLGTVVGMIEIFGSQNATGNDPQALAHGIAVALYNTAFGLIVAIPAAIAHRVFRIRVDQYLHALENAAHLLLEALSQSDHSAATRATSRVKA